MDPQGQALLAIRGPAGEDKISMQPFISIIVPLYNASGFIGNCVNSILRQTFSDFELLLIDDGSTDDSFNVCNHFASLDSRIKCYRKANGGHMDALRFGITKVSGQWLSFCDHDDTFPENALEILVNQIEDETNIIVGFSYPGDGSKYDISPTEWRQKMIHGDIILCTRWAKLYRTSLFNDETCRADRSIIVGEDMLMNIKLAFTNNLPIKVINSKVYNYQQISTSQSVLFSQSLTTTFSSSL